MMTSAFALVSVAACVTQPTASEEKAAIPAPQCWNGDIGAFQGMGVRTSLSGVEVVCERAADGKSAQWMGVKRR